jgi:hypothetical protein
MVERAEKVNGEGSGGQGVCIYFFITGILANSIPAEKAHGAFEAKGSSPLLKRSGPEKHRGER